MNMSLSILFPLIVLLGFVSFVVAAVAYFRSEREPEALQRRFLPRFYTYAMLFVSSLILFVGGGLLLRAGLSYPVGLEFSYRGQPIYAQVEPEKVPLGPPLLQRIEYRPEDRTRDLLNGGAFVGMGVLFLALHSALRNRIETPEERGLSFLNKGYLVMSGVVYGGISLVLIPMGVYRVIEYFFLPRGDSRETFWMRPVPGEILGFAILALALWLWTLPQLFKSLGASEGSS